MDILPIPVANLDDVWTHVWPHLARGVDVCGRTREALSAEILNGSTLVWVASGREPRSVSAAWMTETLVEGDKRCLVVFGLGGEKPAAWVGEVAAAMEAYGKAESCQVVRYAGRRGWGKFLPRCKEAGEMGGQPMFEGAIQ